MTLIETFPKKLKLHLCCIFDSAFMYYAYTFLCSIISKKGRGKGEGWRWITTRKGMIRGTMAHKRVLMLPLIWKKKQNWRKVEKHRAHRWGPIMITNITIKRPWDRRMLGKRKIKAIFSLPSGWRKKKENGRGMFTMFQNLEKFFFVRRSERRRFTILT